MLDIVVTNTVRLHSAIGYVTPADCLAGLSKVIGDERDRKLKKLVNDDKQSVRTRNKLRSL